VTFDLINSQQMESSSSNRSADSRLLEAAADGKTDLILQLLEEEGSKLHDHKDQVRTIMTSLGHPCLKVKAYI